MWLALKQSDENNALTSEFQVFKDFEMHVFLKKGI